MFNRRFTVHKRKLNSEILIFNKCILAYYSGQAPGGGPPGVPQGQYGFPGYGYPGAQPPAAGGQDQN